MAKLVAAFFLSLIAISMLQTMVMASNGHGGHHYDQKHYGPGSLKSYRKQNFNSDIFLHILFSFLNLTNDPKKHNDNNAHHSARGGAARPNTISHACSSVRNAAANACVCPQAITGIKLCALATTIGRPRKEDPSALKLWTIFSSFFLHIPISYF
ncbi:hypothetical protein DITRI_Ditri16bG0114100 [Diplodiscus trichospermus]